MSNEYKLSFTAEEIDEKLRQMGSGSGGGLPVIELETVLSISSGEAIALSANDCLALESVENAQSPIIAKFSIGGAKCSVVLNNVAGAACIYGGVLISDVMLIMMITHMDGPWTCVLGPIG